MHPSCLDAAGLTALWREALLAEAVLRGATRGYRNHPQLQRFRAHSHPLAAVAFYLRIVQEEARRRGYRFTARDFSAADEVEPIPVTTGQVEYEFLHLQAKLRRRAPRMLDGVDPAAAPALHPLFRLVPGGVEPWEKTASHPPRRNA